MKEKIVMTTRKLEIERFSMISSKPFEAVLVALKAAVGHPDMAEFAKAVKNAQTFTELEDSVRRGLGETGLMMFMELDHGAILRQETGLDTPRIVRLLMGNPLIMKDMAKHFGQIRAHVLYKRPEIPANSRFPAIAVSVTCRNRRWRRIRVNTRY
jgi:hypothetical protein